MHANEHERKVLRRSLPPTGQEPAQWDSADRAPSPGGAAAASAAAAVAVALAACGGGGGGGGGESAAALSALPTPVGATSAFAYNMPATNEEAARFLLQAQFHASDAAISSLRTQGYALWLAAQFAAPSGLSGFDWLHSRGYSSLDTTTAYYDSTYPGDYMVWCQLVSAPDGVRKRLALALSEFFVLSLNGLDLSWRSQAVAAWWDMLSSHALGNYRTLLEAVTLSPAMGHYLGVKGNLKENVATGREPDENYGREVMQLFSIGLAQLKLDGSEKKDATGARIDTYGSSDVSALARVFTGWSLDTTQGANTVLANNRSVPPVNTVRQPMTLSSSNHSMLSATFLEVTVPANTDGTAALKIALDTLFNHPNVGPFFGKQMIQRLVTSSPTPAYVARVAQAFNDNGKGVRGDLSAVFAAVLLDDEARSPAGLSQTGFGKLREPILRFTQWARTFGLSSAKGSWKIGDLSEPATRLGQSPLRPPSVFNYFRPSYVPPSTALSASATPAPEFQLVNESSVAGYLNYLQGVVRYGIYVNAPEQPNNASNAATNGFDLTAPYTAELALVLDASALVQRLCLLLCAGQLSAANQTLIVTALNATALTASSTDSAKLDRVAAGVLLVMASSDYLIQK